MDVMCCILLFGLLAAGAYHATQPRIKQNDDERTRGYVVHNKVVHSRFLPATAAHTFAYSTVFLLVSLNALERGSLNLCGGWLFSYGGRYGRVTSLRSSPYLKAGGFPSGIKERLKQCICDHGLDKEDLEHAWMLTMPSYIGLEGINPLTVYFCYRRGGDPWLVVLEIHNTFGEKHVHVLQIKACDTPVPGEGFSHQWTFQREFHVSPFNDRSGYYVVSMKIPPAPSSGADDNAISTGPRVRILLYTSTSDIPRGLAITTPMGPLKLAAHLIPVSCVPLTSWNLVTSVALQPLALLLSLPRILFQAWILHYRKRLNVYVRPEPHPASESWGKVSNRSGGIGWQPETWIDAFARKRFEAFLGGRSRDAHISVTLVPANPATPQEYFLPDQHSEQQAETPSHATLTISYMSSAFFTMMLRAPSPAHALLLATSSNMCHISSTEVFRALFAEEGDQTLAPQHSPSLAQRLRVQSIPASVRYSRPDLAIPARHPIDVNETFSWIGLATVVFVIATRVLEILERLVYGITGTRFVPGEEPWRLWHRALEPQQATDNKDVETTYRLGSTRG